METKEALDIVEEYKIRHGHPGTLEALQAMQLDLAMTDVERIAFNVAMAGFRRLFFGDPND